MALVIVLTVAALGGIVYGVAKKDKKILIISVIALVVIWALSGAYYYLGMKNPY